MAMKQPARTARSESRRPGFFWSRLHFLIRFLGLTGFLVACVGLVLAGLGGLLASWSAAREAVLAVYAGGGPLGAWLVVVGAAAALLALLVEALVVVRFAAGRRSAFGFNALVQVALAAALFVGVNVWSFDHFVKLDWTRSAQFTLPEKVRQELQRLDPNAPTLVVIYQRHKLFGNLSDRPPDDYDNAAERKVEEKVKDLVEQFRAVGPQFRVEVLDVAQRGYGDQLHRVTQDAPGLRQAIEAAPENTIFVYAGGRVQQLSFNEFFQLDRVASQEANGGRGNLILLAQGVPEKGVPFSGRGVEPFARKVLNLEERKPRVGVLVVHDWLTTQGPVEPFTLAGLRKSLEAHGFEVRDVVLKRGWFTGGPLEPAADTPEERQLENLESDRDYYEAGVKALDEDVKQVARVAEDWALKPGEKEKEKLDYLSTKYAKQLKGRRVTDELRQVQAAALQQELAVLREGLAEVTRRRDQARAELDKLPVDELREAGRMSDVKAKLDRALADCDLLLVPRYTRQPNGSLAAPNRLHRLSDAQLASLKEYLQAGKPIFFCLGPVNEPEDMDLMQPDAGGPDGLEEMLAELGVRLNKQTVLFDADARAFGERRNNLLRVDKVVKASPLDFDSPTSVGRSIWARSRPETAPLSPNRIREGLRVLAHSAGGGLDLRIRFPRPVSYEAPAGRQVKEDPIFLLTAGDGWNDAQPFVTRDRRPHYEPPKPDEKTNGTFDEKRRGAFPVGIAVEAPLPSGWSSEPNRAVRLAVIGQGDVFCGPELAPAKERLLLQTANWLLSRDDYLPRAEHPWSYPRVDLAPGSTEEQLWLWGTRLGLPVLFAYLGLVVLLVRRLR